MSQEDALLKAMADVLAQMVVSVVVMFVVGCLVAVIVDAILTRWPVGPFLSKFALTRRFMRRHYVDVVAITSFTVVVLLVCGFLFAGGLEGTAIEKALLGY